jgi:hypothetical protein
MATFVLLSDLQLAELEICERPGAAHAHLLATQSNSVAVQSAHEQSARAREELAELLANCRWHPGVRNPT